jgi:hypothetical protein
MTMPMNKNILLLLIFAASIIQTNIYAAQLHCNSGSGSCIEVPPEQIPPPNHPGLITRFGCFTGIDCNRSSSMVLDTELLNLKNNVSVPNAKVASSNVAIQITQTDFEGFVQAGKSLLFSQGLYDYFYMNIGTADAINAQTWTLPSNLAEYVDGSTSRLDILSPSQIPVAMQVAGATHVLKEIISEPNGNEVDSYMHLQIDGTEVTDLGSSYDFDEGSDDNFDEEPDVELYDVPLDLGDNQITEEFPIEENLNGNFLKIQTETIVDAFGTINTPYGSFPCLRQTENVKYFRRASESVAYGTQANYEIRRVKWITKNGFVFSAAVQDEDVNHVGLLGFMEQTRFVPTNTLTSQSAVKISNDSKGVAINNTDFVADESAILDINSDSLGILIPRILMANRPSSPAEGLLVYQVDNTAGFYYFDGTAWQRLSANPPVSMSANARISNSEILENSSIRGKNQLNKGSVFVKFDQPQDNFENSLINIQLEGDCNGVFISKKTREGFEVKELHKGKSNVKFSWQIN